MASMIFYNGIGVFNGSNVLVAQGSQQIKFTGSVGVSQVLGQTVVNVGGGGSVTGDPNTLAIFDSGGVIGDDLGAVFFAPRLLMGLDNTGDGSFDTTPNCNMMMINGSIIAGGSGGGLAGNVITHLMANGSNVLAMSGTHKFLESFVTGNNNNITVSGSGTTQSAVIAGDGNTIVSPNPTTGMVIIGRSNTYAPLAFGAIKIPLVVGSSNSLTGGVPAQVGVFGVSNVINTKNNVGGGATGNFYLIGAGNQITSVSGGATSITSVGVSNQIIDSGPFSVFTNCASFGNLNVMDLKNDSHIYQVGGVNSISVQPVGGISQSIQTGYGNTIISTGASSGVSVFGKDHFVSVSSATNTTIVGRLNTINGIISSSSVYGDGNNVNSSVGTTGSVVVGNANTIAHGAVLADKIGLFGHNLTAPIMSNHVAFGLYNDSSDLTLKLSFGSGALGTPVNAFGVKSNNSSLDCKIVNYRPVVSSAAPGGVLTINASLMDISANLAVTNFSAGVNDGQLVTIRALNALGMSIASSGLVILPGAATLNLTQYSSANFAWSASLNKWTLLSYVLY